MADQVTKYTLQFDADTRKLLQGLQQVESQSKKTEKTVKSLGQVTKESFRGIGFSDIAQIAAGTALITKSVQAYGQLVNVQQTATQVFGEGYAEISEFAKQAVEDVGLSERAAIEMTTKLAGLGKAAGISGENLGKFSISLTRLGADLGAAFNTSTQRAVEAMMSALSGSSIEPLREYNIVLSDTILKQELASITGEKVVGTMTQQQRTLAVYSKLIKSTADYQGQWDRESAGLLGTQQRLAAEWENLSAQMGENYAPSAQAALDITLGLSRAFMSVDNAMGGILSGFVGFGAAALAIQPLLGRLRDYNTALVENGRAGTAWQKGIAAGPPVILGLTAALAGLTVWQAQTTKGAAQATEGILLLGQAGEDSSKQLASLETTLEGVGKATAGPAESFTRMFEAFKSGDPEAMFKSTFFGPLVDWWDDKGSVTSDEITAWFEELAITSPKAALAMLEAAKGNSEYLATLNEAGLGLNFMNDAVNRGIIASHNAALSQTELDAIYEETAKDLGVAEGAVLDYNAALTEDIDKIKERVAVEQQLVEAYMKMAEARPGKVADEFAKMFAADTGLDALGNIRSIRDIVASFADLEGTIPSIADTLDPENELAGSFLDAMQNLQDEFGPALEAALEQGGAGALQTAGAKLRMQLGDALREAGYQDEAIQEIFDQLGLTISDLDLTAKLSLEATISEEAQTLLDLARGEGLISFGDYLKLKASLDVDPAGTKSTVEAMLADQGIEVPLEAGEEIDYAAAAAFMAEQKIPIPMEGKIGAAAEKAKIQTEMTRLGPVKVPMEGKLDLTSASSQLNAFITRPRTITIGVSAPSAASSGGGSNPGGGGATPGPPRSAAAASGQIINNVRNYFTIPTADPSAHIRAAERWSRLNGQPTPQITPRSMMSDVEYLSRKISTLPLRSPVLATDLVVVVGDGTPPDGYLGSVDDIAALAGTYAPQGPAGPTGPAGPVGPPGASLNVDGSVPDVADLDGLNVPPGSCYVVGSDGSIWIYDGTDWIEMQSATGAQGPQGPPGAQGPVGPKGDTGPAGAQGIAGANVPTGVVLDYAGQVAPAGFVLCDGAYYDPALPAYAALYAIIGYLYGQDANGHFRTPPFNGRVAVSRDPANANFGTTGKLGGRADTPLKQHRHGSGTLLMPNHSHDIAHSHPQGVTAEATVPPNYMHLPGFAAGLYIQGQNNAAWPPTNRGVTLLNPVQFAASGWDWLFADGNGNITLQGDGRHAHYFTTPALGYGAARSETVTGAVTGETQDQGESTAANTAANYPPYITINKIIRL